MAALLFNVSRLTFRKKLYRTKLQTYLPVKICHLKVYRMTDDSRELCGISEYEKKRLKENEKVLD